MSAIVDDKRKAKLVALRKLSRRGYLAEELKKKLLEKGIQDKLIDEILVELREAGYLNDDEWIGAFIRKEIRQHHGPYLIVQKLRLKGAAVESIRTALAKEYPLEIRLEEIQTLLQKLKGRPRQNIIAAINRRGFAISEIISVLK